jgi:predicted nucleotidyltransferase
MKVVYDDIEDEVASYPLGEDTYLDMDFLQAMGNIDDRGLAAETL